MILLELILILALIVILLRKRNSRSFTIKTLLVSVFLGLISILLFEFFNGAHPECGANDSVGPCAYSERVIYDLPLIFLPTILFWVIILSVDVLFRYARNRLATGKK